MSGTVRSRLLVRQRTMQAEDLEIASRASKALNLHLPARLAGESEEERLLTQHVACVIDAMRFVDKPTLDRIWQSVCAPPFANGAFLRLLNRVSSPSRKQIERLSRDIATLIGSGYVLEMKKRTSQTRQARMQGFVLPPVDTDQLVRLAIDQALDLTFDAALDQEGVSLRHQQCARMMRGEVTPQPPFRSTMHDLKPRLVLNPGWHLADADRGGVENGFGW